MIDNVKLGKIYKNRFDIEKYIVPIQIVHNGGELDVYFYDLKRPQKRQLGSLKWVEMYWSEVE